MNNPFEDDIKLVQDYYVDNDPTFEIKDLSDVKLPDIWSKSWNLATHKAFEINRSAAISEKDYKRIVQFFRDEVDYTKIKGKHTLDITKDIEQLRLPTANIQKIVIKRVDRWQFGLIINGNDLGLAERDYYVDMLLIRYINGSLNQCGTGSGVLIHEGFPHV